MGVFVLLACLLLVHLAQPAAAGVLVRRNVLSLTPQDRDRWVNAVNLLKRELAPNPITNLYESGWSTYDNYVFKHFNFSMLAHQGPAFFPWHRALLANFERDLQRVSNDSSLAIPYWNWLDLQHRMDVWSVQLLGGNGTGPNMQIQDGPFSWWLAANGNGTVSPFGIQRGWGTKIDAMPGMHMNLSAPVVLPYLEDIFAAMNITNYDSAPYSMMSHNSFRNFLEGFADEQCKLHNQLHIWIGGHMRTVPVSPNDPVFWLHHSFVDKMYDIWQRINCPTAKFACYEPLSGQRKGQNLHDELIPWGMRIDQVLHSSQLGYVYAQDSLDYLIQQRFNLTANLFSTY